MKKITKEETILTELERQGFLDINLYTCDQPTTENESPDIEVLSGSTEEIAKRLECSPQLVELLTMLVGDIQQGFMCVDKDLKQLGVEIL